MRHLSLLIFLICAGPVLAESPDCLPVEVAILSHDGSEKARYVAACKCFAKKSNVKKKKIIGRDRA